MWVTIMSVCTGMSGECQMSSSSSRRVIAVNASSAENGSSISSTFGSTAERAREPDPLLHPAGELARIGFFETVEADLIYVYARDSFAFCGTDAARFETHFDIGLDRQPRQQRERLEHQRAFEVDAIDLASVVKHLTRSGRDDSVDDAHQR